MKQNRIKVITKPEMKQIVTSFNNVYSQMTALPSQTDVHIIDLCVPAIIYSISH